MKALYSRRRPESERPPGHESAIPLARTAKFLLCDQADLGCPVPFEKIFFFAPDPNQLHIPCRLVPLEGRIAIVTDAGRDAVDVRAPGAQWQSQGEMNLVNGQRRAG